MKNIKYSSRNSRNTAFSAKIGCSNDFYINNVLCEKTMKYKEKVQSKSAETAISGVLPAFSAIISKIGLGHVLSIAKTHLWAKSKKKIIAKSRRNAKRLVFPAYFSQKLDSAIFWALLIRIFMQNLCKKSEKTNDEISRKCQKTGFSGIFPAFSAEKKNFRKSVTLIF